MNKENREKTGFIGFLIVSIGFFIVAILNFIDKNTGTATVFLCLGFSFLGLSSTHWPKAKNRKDKS